MLLAEHYQVWAFVLMGSVGNISGSCVNCVLGRFIAQFGDKRWFPLSKLHVGRAEGWYHHCGRWSLLLSWVPVIGDPLTIVAGVLRKPFLVFLGLVAVAKTLRHAGVAALSLGWM